MKWTYLGVSALCAVHFSTAAAQDAPDITIFSFEDISCGAWTRSRGNEQWRAIYGAWFRGFVSGYNFGNSANQVPLAPIPHPPPPPPPLPQSSPHNPQPPLVPA